MPLRPPLPLSSRVSELVPFWLELRCCQGTTYLPLRMLAESGRANAVLGDVLTRLRCRFCGDEPVTVALVESAASRIGWQSAGLAGGSEIGGSVSQLLPGCGYRPRTGPVTKADAGDTNHGATLASPRPNISAVSATRVNLSISSLLRACRHAALS
jgi:hypothetical protein